jgi:peptidoglycan DL-endopeptidase CwlO
VSAHRSISAGAVALAGLGGLAVWAAMKGVELGSGVRAVLSGQPLPAGDSLIIDTSNWAKAGRAIGAGNGSIAGTAGQYIGAGHKYRWGGGSPDGWDCSGFVNWVLCHDLGMAIPGYTGGSFDGRAHGPVTAQWALWSGASSIPRAQVGPGDLCIWPLFHMGIAADNGTMINAPGPNGTPAPILSQIDGAARGPLVCRRLTGAG